MWRCLVALAFCSLSAFNHSHAQLPEATFHHLGVEDGLPSTRTTAVSQGPDDLIWIGTAAGLVLYNGYELSPITDRNHPLSTTPISSIVHDQDGGTWVATQGNGLFLVRDADTSPSRIAADALPDKIHDLAAGEDDLWIAAEESLFRFRFDSGELVELALPDSVQSVHAILALGDSAAVSTDQGLFYTHDPQQLYPFQAGPDLAVNDLHRSAAGVLWAATGAGLFRFDQQQQKFVGFRHDSDADTPQRDAINSITQDQSGRHWFAGDRIGVCRFIDDGPIECYRYRSGDNTSLSANSVRALLVDREDNLWVATAKGVARLSLRSLAFGTYTDAPHGPLECLSDPHINAIFAENGAVWLGSNGGLVRWGDSCTHFPSSEEEATTLSAPEVYALRRKDEQHLWIATSDGLDLLNEATGKVQRNVAGFTEKTPTYGFAQSKNGDLLVHARKTILRRRLGTEAFEPVAISDEQLNTYIWSIEPIGNGEFWVGTAGGLGRMRSIDGPVELMRNPEGAPLFSHVIGALHAEADDRVWVGVDKLGLFLLGADGEILEHYDETSGLANLEFSAIVPDRHNRLWISTRRGIARMDKATRQITAFRKDDGLQSEFFMQNAADTGPDGKLYFGGQDGINVFWPEQIMTLPTVKPKLSGLYVDGERVQSQPDSEHAVLTRPIAKARALEFSHQDDAFSLEFLSLSHTAPQRIRYAYRLEGAHSNWNLGDAQNRRATYTSLQPGTYTFHFKAAAPHGDWVEGDPLQIRILPPPWLTPWAFAAYALFLVAAVLALFILRTRALRKRTLLLEKRVAERTGTIEALLDKKNEELANLSHEFRTPLTLVLGPIKSLLARVESEETRRKLQVAQRNSQRLLRMVDQLLQMERFKVQKALKPRPQRVKPIARQISKSFEELGAEKHIQLTVGQIDDVWLAFAPDAFEKILLNLLSNALKYTEPGGQVSLSLLEDGQQARLTVTDTGIGIAEDKQQQVFERYQRAVDEHSEKIVGTGIGLALVKELVEAHGGRIELHSALGQGSSFVVTMPLAEPEGDEEAESSFNTDLLELELASLARPETASPVSPEAPTGNPDGTTHILVIEDNADMRAYIMETLAETGYYQISAAADGKEGLEAARQEVPDLIISDVMMPVMDGYEVVRELKGDDRTSHIPIILLTARGDRKSRLRGWNEKADEYLTKPFDEAELQLRVRNLLDVRSLLQKRYGTTHFPGGQPPSPGEDDALNPRDQAFLEKFKAVIEQYHTDPDLKVADMAQHLAMSERPLQRKLKALLGHTPNEYLRAYRLERASERLRQGETVAEVAFAVGFSSQSYFSTCFKAHFGVAPSGFAGQ